jgi:hypothetical protein
MERFNLRKLREAEGKEQIVLRSQVGSQLWNIWMLGWTLRMLAESQEAFQGSR